MVTEPATAGRLRALAGFASLGLFWGAWGALVPAIQAGAHTTDAEFGVAVLMVGLGALTSMRLTGALIDRRGGVVLPVTAGLFGATALLPGLAGSPVALGGALLLVGAASGALDVAANAAGVDEEIASGRPLMNLAHASFSATVVVASLATGALRGAGVGPAAILAGVLGLILLAALGPLRRGGAPHRRAAASTPGSGAPPERRSRWPAPVLLGLGSLCALAFVVENAWQTWSAAHLEKTLGAPAGLSALAPAVFAAAAVSGRLGGNAALARLRRPVLLALGGLVAALGGLVAALAGSPVIALAGVALAGLGTSVCAPTIISMTGAWAGPERRAAAVSTVTTVAYLGFLVGPAAVGFVASTSTLAAALAATAGLAAIVAALAPLTARIRTVPGGRGDPG